MATARKKSGGSKTARKAKPAAKGKAPARKSPARAPRKPARAHAAARPSHKPSRPASSRGAVPKRPAPKTPARPAAKAKSAPKVVGKPAVKGAPKVVGKPAVKGAATVIGKPAVKGAPKVIGKPAVKGTPTVVGKPAVKGAPKVIGKPAVKGAPKAAAQVEIPKPVPKGPPRLVPATAAAKAAAKAAAAKASSPKGRATVKPHAEVRPLGVLPPESIAKPRHVVARQVQSPARHAAPSKPAPAVKKGDDRLTPEDLEHFEQRLLSERGRIMREMGHLENTVLKVNPRDSAGELSGYSFHMADAGTDSMEREKAFDIASKEGRLLMEIDDALRRLYNGTYGICEVSGKPISRARLEALPWARLSIAEQEKLEKEQRAGRLQPKSDE